MKHVLLSPHNDDAVLFASFILQRLRGDICTITVFDSHVQDAILGRATADLRRREDLAAHEELGVPVMFAGLMDCANYVDERVCEAIAETYYKMPGRVDGGLVTLWAPESYACGHTQHNQVYRAANLLVKYHTFASARFYHTYSRLGFKMKPGHSEANYGGSFFESKPPDRAAIQKKLRALACYESQISEERLGCREHFMRDLREWVRE